MSVISVARVVAPIRTCAVYKTRPDPCRRFSDGSPECNESRSRVGLPKLLSL